VPGLVLRVTSGDIKTFALWYRVHGRPRRYTFGRYPTVSLADAREQAQNILAGARRGEDAQAAKLEARTAADFTSWLTLAPNNKISGGRLLSSHTQPSANRAATILRVAAMYLARTDTALGAFYRRLGARIGKAKAITATARKLAILVYRCLKGEIVYKDPGAAAYDRQHRDVVLRRLRRRAAALGFNLVNGTTGEILEGVS
jgi:hypothetical protein